MAALLPSAAVLDPTGEWGLLVWAGMAAAALSLSVIATMPKQSSVAALEARIEAIPARLCDLFFGDENSGLDDDFDDPRDLAESIAEHMEPGRELQHVGPGREADYIEDILTGEIPTISKAGDRGRRIYVDLNAENVIITDPRSADGGTAYPRPGDAHDYYDAWG